MSRILVIEDELPMRLALIDCLQGHGYHVTSAADGVSGLERALEEKPDLLVLDVMMPRLDGFAVCREVRARAASLTILMLTAKGLVDDRVAGLDAGADDYLVKPFSTRELLARVRALLRRNQRCAATVERLRLGGAEIDFVRQQCERAGKRIALTAKEFAMLKLFAEEPSVPISRERFLEIVWGYHAFPTLRTVDNQILSLRAKLEPDPAHPIYITTVHGVGYRLEMTRP